MSSGVSPSLSSFCSSLYSSRRYSELRVALSRLAGIFSQKNYSSAFKMNELIVKFLSAADSADAADSALSALLAHFSCHPVNLHWPLSQLGIFLLNHSLALLMAGDLVSALEKLRAIERLKLDEAGEFEVNSSASSSSGTGIASTGRDLSRSADILKSEILLLLGRNRDSELIALSLSAASPHTHSHSHSHSHNNSSSSTSVSPDLKQFLSLYRIRLLLQFGNHKSARKELKSRPEPAAGESESRELALLKSQLDFVKGNYKKSLDRMRAMKLTGDDEAININSIAILIAENKCEAAKMAAMKLLASRANCGRASFNDLSIIHNSAYALLLGANYSGALELFAALDNWKRFDPLIQLRAGECARKLQRWESALNWFKRAALNFSRECGGELENNEMKSAERRTELGKLWQSAMINVAEIQLRTGKFEAADQTIKFIANKFAAAELEDNRTTIDRLQAIANIKLGNKPLQTHTQMQTGRTQQLSHDNNNGDQFSQLDPTGEFLRAHRISTECNSKVDSFNVSLVRTRVFSLIRAGQLDAARALINRSSDPS